MDDMETKYDLSIIIPVYNVEKYLPICLSSLKTNSNRCQIVLVDDGSTDKSLDICKNYALYNKNVIVISQANMGVTAARKAGSKSSVGKYVLCVDGDDYLQNGAIDKFLADAALYDVDMINYGYSDENGIHRTIAEDGFYENERLPELCDNFFYDDKIGDENGGRLFYPLWSRMIKRDIFLEWQCKQSNELTIGEDAILSYLCLKSSRKVIVSNYAGYFYRTSASSAMNKFSPVRFLKNDLFVETVKELNPNPKVYQYLAYHSLISVIKSLANSTTDFKTFYITISESRKFKCWKYVKELRISNPRKETYIKELILRHRLTVLMWILFKRKWC